MGFPRSRTVDPAACAVYHCVSRCARRLFLIADAVRADWIVRRLEFLASVFAVDVLEYAVLSNHVHLILRLRPELAWCWTDAEVAEGHRLRAATMDGTGGIRSRVGGRTPTLPTAVSGGR